jgi:hypothetical protein
MNYSLSYSLGKRLGIQDPSAVDYISAVRTAGATVTSAQASEINTFYKTAKSTGYYTSLKRLYLPIWGVAAANAIDMITGASGTWNGGVTHGAGFVQGNGSTGYFDMGVKSGALGVTAGDGFHGWLSNGGGTANTSANYIGATSADFTASFFSRFLTDIGIDYFHLNIAGFLRQTIPSIDSNRGIVISRRKSGVREISRRDSAARSIIATATNADQGSANPDFTLFAMAANNGGGADTPADVRFSAFFVGVDLTGTQAEAFSLHLKNLFEATTGLTLP